MPCWLVSRSFECELWFFGRRFEASNSSIWVVGIIMSRWAKEQLDGVWIASTTKIVFLDNTCELTRKCRNIFRDRQRSDPTLLLPEISCSFIADIMPDFFHPFVNKLLGSLQFNRVFTLWLGWMRWLLHAKPWQWPPILLRSGGGLTPEDLQLLRWISAPKGEALEI